jgi:murein DD-endopeptidase MepM/ murein hydrolase activator NlpD
MHLVLALLLIASPAVAPSPRWQWPVDPPRVVSRAYLAPATPYGAGHRGIDIETESTRVYAPADGVVHFAGYVVDRPVLSIAHPGGILSSFEPVTTTLIAGDPVHRGQLVGTIADGHCTVITCLHFGVRVGGEYVSPLLFLGGVPRSVLVPTRQAALGALPRRRRREHGVTPAGAPARSSA